MATFRYADFGVSSVSPNFGPLAGNSEITVSGYGFEDSVYLKCSFNGVASDSVTLVSDTEIKCSLPPHSTAELVKVDVTINGNDHTTNSAQFQYLAEAVTTSISPSSGNFQGGTRLLVSGFNFVDSDALACR